METKQKNGWGGRRANQTGRPKKDVTRDCCVYVRVTAEEKARLEEKAAAAGKSVSRFLIELALNAEESRALP